MCCFTVVQHSYHVPVLLYCANVSTNLTKHIIIMPQTLKMMHRDFCELLATCWQYVSAFFY